MTQAQNSANTFDKTEPAILIGGRPVSLSALSTAGATNSQVLTYSSSSGAWIPGNAVAAALTSAHLFVGNGSNVATDVAMSGDATISNTGAVAVTKLTITSAATGDLLYYNGTAWVRLPAGTIGQVLTMGASIPAWA